MRRLQNSVQFPSNLHPNTFLGNLTIFQISHWRSFVKKYVLKNFENFTGKHLCMSLFSIKFVKFAEYLHHQLLRAPILKNICNDCISITISSSHQRCSIKKSGLKNFAIFRGKYLCQGLFFNKVVGLRSVTALKKRLLDRCFPVKFVKFLRTPFLQNTSG